VGDPIVTDASPPLHGGPLTLVPLVRVLPVAGARAATVVLDGAPVAIGREGHVAGPLALPDSEISRHHATIERVDGAWTIADQGSRNGTFVDGRRVERAPLADGTVVRVGRTLLVHAAAELRSDERLPPPPRDSRLVGDSIPALRVQAEIELVARQALPVLILGDTGVGKELVAGEIHRRSGRAGRFVAINCAAIAPELAESELFGHVAGAFTGASRSAEGVFVAAHGGTLFLDEVGELPSALQAKLLRALANGEVRPVGASAAQTVDVRVIAATLRDLDAAVREEHFRTDLLNRLAGWRVHVPSLNARRDDIIAITGTFLARHAGLALTADAAEALVLHDWTGNVRELERVVAAAAVRALAVGSAIDLAHLPPALGARLRDRPRATVVTPPPPAILVPAPGAVPTRDELCATIEQMAGNMARVAEHYRKDRQQIYRWVHRYGIDVGAYRKADS
jgi:transcriptional regulator with GAF, ATPase, and Fis domain